ncbi:MAG: WecB/TagA/CpsF family glycosyltransferase [Candidatus Binatia bacterium]
MARVNILNGSFDSIVLGEAVDAVGGMIRSGRRGYVATVNVAILMMMRSDPRLQRFVDRAELVVADGQPIVFASRWSAAPLPERVAGIDLLEALLARAEREQFRVYLLGGLPAVVSDAARRIRERWPGLAVCGVADGYFSAEEAEERARAVARSEAHLLIVGMGVPRQEYFVETHWQELGAKVAIGVGGALEVLAGVRQRAPRALQTLGLEWLFRLAQEPRRLSGRYLVTNSQFIYLLLKERLRVP